MAKSEATRSADQAPEGATGGPIGRPGATNAASSAWP